MYEDDLELRPCKLQLSGFQRLCHAFGEDVTILK